MKRKTKIIISVVAVLAVVAAGIAFFGIYNSKLVNVDDYNDIDKLIKTTQQSFVNDADYKKFNKTVSDEVIKKTKYYLVKNKDYAAVFYTLDKNSDVIILKKDGRLSNKYKVIKAYSSESREQKCNLNDENFDIFALYLTKNNGKYDEVQAYDTKNKKELFSQKINAYPYYILLVNDKSSNAEIKYLKDGKTVEIK